LAINYAIDYHNWIGPKKKEARLRYLQNYWTSKLQGTKHILINTPLAAEKSCAIANVGIQGLAASELAKTLLNKYKIWTVAIDHANVHGVRITPHLYTTEKELDALVNALIEISKAQTH
jgi:selenocysteine lyase/cysteine desulfurase